MKDEICTAGRSSPDEKVLDSPEGSISGTKSAIGRVGSILSSYRELSKIVSSYPLGQVVVIVTGRKITHRSNITGSFGQITKLSNDNVIYIKRKIKLLTHPGSSVESC